MKLWDVAWMFVWCTVGGSGGGGWGGGRFMKDERRREGQVAVDNAIVTHLPKQRIFPTARTLQP